MVDSLCFKVGSNSKRASKEDEKAAKEQERLRKEAEKAMLLAEEEEAIGGIYVLSCQIWRENIFILFEWIRIIGVKKIKPKKAKKKDDIGALLSEGLSKAPKV